jgi:glycosyltransferase involved in cell wall biosynthesis
MIAGVRKPDAPRSLRSLRALARTGHPAGIVDAGSGAIAEAIEPLSDGAESATLRPAPLRILQVLHRAGRGGIESAMLEVLRRIQRARYRIDFVARSAEPGEHDDELRELGAQIFVCPRHRNPLNFARRLGRILAHGGPYDAIHSHVEHYSGIVLAVAAAAGVPVRVAHIHNDRSAEPAGAARLAYRRLMAAAVARFATHGFAPSAAAAGFLFGERWHFDPRWRVLPYGIDFAPYHRPIDRRAMRAAIGIPDDALVIGHVGRFLPQKNHQLVIEILARLFAREPGARAVLIGDGPLRAEIAQAAKRAGIKGRLRFLGARSDVPDLLRGVIDVFLFPSRYEGFGLALLEAQAAGLPCVISDVIPPEADALGDRLQRLPLGAPIDTWVAAIRSAATAGRQADAVRRLERTHFAVEASIAAYTAAYRGINVAVPARQPGFGHAW